VGPIHNRARRKRQSSRTPDPRSGDLAAVRDRQRLMMVRALLALTVMRPRPLHLLLSALFISACELPPSAVPTDGAPPLAASARRGQFRADPAIQPGEEAYICYSIDVEGISGVHVGRVTWHPPTGPVTLHHAALFAAAGLPDVGELPCDPMPT